MPYERTTCESHASPAYNSSEMYSELVWSGKAFNTDVPLFVNIIFSLGSLHIRIRSFY